MPCVADSSSSTRPVNCCPDADTGDPVPAGVSAFSMNDGLYPHSNTCRWFDLMADQPAPKAIVRAAKAIRYLFWKPCWRHSSNSYISYVAHSAIDNRDLMPSVLVTELVEYVEIYMPFLTEDAEAETEQETALSSASY